MANIDLVSMQIIPTATNGKTINGLGENLILSIGNIITKTTINKAKLEMYDSKINTSVLRFY